MTSLPPPDGSATPATVGDLDSLLASCGITDAGQQRYIRNDQKLRYYADWLDMEEDDFKNISKAATKLATGHFSIGVLTLKRLYALTHWIRDHVLMGKRMDNINPSRWNKTAIRDYLRIAYRTDNRKVDKPDPLSDSDDWVVWRKHLLVYLQTVNGEQGCAIAYIIRLDSERPDTMTGLTRDEKIFWNAPHEGYGFDEDNKTVFQLMQTLLENSSSTHILSSYESSQDAVGAWLALTGLYDGEGEVTKRAIDARRKLKAMKYVDERTKQFVTIVAEMKGHFRSLEIAHCKIMPAEQVNRLCDDVLFSVTNTDIRNAMSNGRTLHREDFTKCANLVSAAICRTDGGGGVKRHVASAQTSGAADDNPDWNSCDPVQYCNGVDVRHVLDPKTPNMWPGTKTMCESSPQCWG